MRKPTRILLILLIIVGGGLLAIQLLLHSSVKSMIATSSSSQKRKNIKSTVAINSDEEKDSDATQKKASVKKNLVADNKPAKHSVFDDLVTMNPRDPFVAIVSDDEKNHDRQQQQHELTNPSQDEDWFPEKTQKISDESKRDRWSEPALLKNYVAKRAHRACDNLPSNATITQSEDIVLGEVSITRMPKWRQEQLRGKKSSSSSSSTTKCSYAFVLMVSNHKYVDGALVMAETMWRTSSKLKKGEICLVMLTSEKLHVDSIRQLSLLFDVVKAMRTLGTFVPKSYYAPTFDKAYLWSLTEYKHIMFLDADHYVNDAEQIEALLISAGGSSAADNKKKKHENKNKINYNEDKDDGNNNNNTTTNDDAEASIPENRIVAVGDHDYFQTGLMILKPNMNIFVDLYLEFRYGTFGYNQWRARDGILIRNCFLKSNEGIGHPGGIFHFYGFFKPWFDFRKSRKITKEPIQFDGMYIKWWNVYEDLHLQLFRYMPSSAKTLYGGGRKNRKSFLRDQAKRKFRCHGKGNKKDADHEEDEHQDSTIIDPDCFVWLQRHRENEEYVQPLSFVKTRWWNLKVPSLKIVVMSGGGEGNNNNNNNKDETKKTDCNSICKRKNLVCRDDAFQWSMLSNCDALSKLLQTKEAFIHEDEDEDEVLHHQKDNANSSSSTNLRCKSCSLRTDGTSLPYVNLQTQECSIHSFFAQKFQPRCDADFNVNERTSMMKICPCVTKAEQNISGVVIN